MAKLAISGDKLTVALNWWEKIAAARSHFHIPLRAIVGVGVVESTLTEASIRTTSHRPVQAVRIPGVTATGVYRDDDTGRTTFMVCHRDGPGIVLRLKDATVDRIIISTREAEKYARDLREHPRTGIVGDS